MYDFLHEWAVENEPEKAAIWFADREKMLAVLRLYMGIGMKRRRKDFIYARQIMELIGYFFGTSESEEKDGFKLDAQLTKGASDVISNALCSAKLIFSSLTFSLMFASAASLISSSVTSKVSNAFSERNGNLSDRINPSYL